MKLVLLPNLTKKASNALIHVSGLLLSLKIKSIPKSHKTSTLNKFKSWSVILIFFIFLKNLCISTHSVDTAHWVGFSLSLSAYRRWRMTHHNNLSHFIILVSWFISVQWDRHTHGSPHCAPLNTLTHTNSVINKAWEPGLQGVITPWSPAKLWWEVSGPWLQKPLTRSLYSSFWSHFSLKCHSHGFLEGIYVSFFK